MSSSPAGGRPIRIHGEKTRENRNAIRVCLIVLTSISIVWAMVAAQTVLLPTCFAVILALLLAPVVRSLEDNFGMPSWLAATAVTVLTACILGMLVMIVIPGLSDWLKHAPDFVRALQEKLAPLQKSFSAVDQMTRDIGRMGGQRSVPTIVTPRPNMIEAVATATPGAVATTFYVIILTLFLLVFRSTYRARLILLPKDPVNRLRVARIIRDVRASVSRYLFVLASINVCLAVITACLFMALDISGAVLWGLAFGLLNFIPMLGPITLIIACGLVSFATEPNIIDGALPPAILLVIHTIEANFVQPWLLSKRIVINPFAIFVGVSMLVALWGPLGALVAVPMLILIYTVSCRVPSMRFIAMLLASEYRNPAPAPRKAKAPASTRTGWRVKVTRLRVRLPFPRQRKTLPVQPA
ncbi:MAG TPA: AI-2E family transporter [Parvibaculum sp.]|jgi:predicted PurR-regulated permease PerM